MKVFSLLLILLFCGCSSEPGPTIQIEGIGGTYTNMWTQVLESSDSLIIKEHRKNFFTIMRVDSGFLSDIGGNWDDRVGGVVHKRSWTENCEYNLNLCLKYDSTWYDTICYKERICDDGD